MKKRLAYILIFCMFLFLAGCSGNEEVVDTEEDEKIEESIKVYASIFPIYDFAKNIGGDKIDLELIVPPGVDAHDWEPTGRLMVELEDADLILYNGIEMEPWTDKVFGSISTPENRISQVTQNIELLEWLDDHHHNHEHHDHHDHHDHDHNQDHNHEHDHDCDDHHHDHDCDDHHHDHDDHHDTGCGHSHGDYDPHVWLSPANAIKMSQNIKDALIVIDEGNKEYYENNFENYKGKLEELDKEYKENLKNLERKHIVVAHAAFGYLTERYGLEQIAIAGISPQEEFSASKMAEISDLVNEKGIKYIFFETLTSPRTAEVLALETGTKTAVLNPLEGLTKEDMNQNKDYISIMRENLETLIKALGE